MRPQRFQSLLADAARKVGADQVQTFTDAGHAEHPFGITMHLGAGAVWWSLTVASAPGDSYLRPEGAPVSGARPEPIHIPELGPGVPLEAVEQALAGALLALDEHAEIARIERFSQREGSGAIPFGMTVVFHNGAKAFVNSLATVRAGQDTPRGRWYEVAATV